VNIGSMNILQFNSNGSLQNSYYVLAYMRLNVITNE